MKSYKYSLFFADNCFESLRTFNSSNSVGVISLKYTALANTPPAAGPLPASSVPMTSLLNSLSNSNNLPDDFVSFVINKF